MDNDGVRRYAFLFIYAPKKEKRESTRRRCFASVRASSDHAGVVAFVESGRGGGNARKRERERERERERVLFVLSIMGQINQSINQSVGRKKRERKREGEELLFFSETLNEWESASSSSLNSSLCTLKKQEENASTRALGSEREREKTTTTTTKTTTESI